MMAMDERLDQLLAHLDGHVLMLPLRNCMHSQATGTRYSRRHGHLEKGCEFKRGECGHETSTFFICVALLRFLGLCRT